MHNLENDYWQVGILPDVGGSMHYGRAKIQATWRDILRPPDASGKINPSNFLMLPWANRIRDGRLRFQGQTWQLETSADDGTARHGDVRKRAWDILNASLTRLELAFDSRKAEKVNFPFAFSATLTYALEGRDFLWQVSLKNEETEQAFPAGFGFHPYFNRLGESMPLLQVPCEQEFVLQAAMASSAPQAISPRLDFRSPRPVTAADKLDDLLTGRKGLEPCRLIYPDWQAEVQIFADAIFQQILLYTAPDGSLAVEPQTNANDGFNLYEEGIAGSGVFVLAPQEAVQGTVRLHLA